MPIPRVVDISKWQPHYTGAQFAQAARAGVMGIINRTTFGTGVDPSYAQRRPLVKGAGLEWAGYGFPVHGTSIKTQADAFLRALAPDDKTGAMLDWEDYPAGKRLSADEALEWCGYVEQRLGRKPWIYSGNTAKEVLGTRIVPAFGAHRLVLAMYASRRVCQASWSAPWLWQYSDSKVGPLPHGVPGLGPVDMDDYVPDDNVTDLALIRASLAREWITNPQAPSAPKPSNNVGWVQDHLNTLGFRDAAGKPLITDGHYGPKTEQAVRAFQKAKGLQVDGVFGPITSAALDLALAQLPPTATRAA